MHIEFAPTQEQYLVAKRQVLLARKDHINTQSKNNKCVLFDSLEEMLTQIYHAISITQETINGQEVVLMTRVEKTYGKNRKRQIKLIKNEDFYECPGCGGWKPECKT